MLLPTFATHVARAASKAARIRRDIDGNASIAATTGNIAVKVDFQEDDTDEYPAMDNGFPSAIRSNGAWEAFLPAKAVVDLPKTLGNPQKSYRPILRNIVIDEHSANGVVKTAAVGSTTTAQASLTTIDGTFPDLESVIPTEAPATTVHVNPFLLKMVLDTACKMLDKNADPCVTIEIRPDGVPIVIRAAVGDGRGNMIAVVMPLVLKDGAP